jgi:hypothetical protein
MRRRDWLLLLLALDGAPDGLDPVRLQKGMFLLAQEGGIPQRERYWFVPYNYGPMSSRLYGDVDALVRAGLAERARVPGYAWTRVRVTDAGRREAATLAARARREPGSAEALRRLAGIKARIVALGFGELLESIYARYPWVAVRSVFRRS